MPNIFHRIFNAITSSPPPTPAAPVAGLQAIHLPVKQAIGASDEWEKKFASPPYFFGGVIAQNGFRTDARDNRPPITESQLRRVYERAGGDDLLATDGKAKLADIKARWDAVDQKLNEMNFFAASRLWRESQAKAANALLDGQPIDAKDYHGKMGEISTARIGLHAQKKDLSALAYEVLAPACAKFKTAARQLAVEQDFEENEHHEKFFAAVQGFRPSELLRGYIFIALELAEAPVRNFKLIKHLTPPDPANVFSLWYNSPPPPVVASTPFLQSLATAAENRAAMEKAARENERAEREKAIAEKNALTERIKQVAAAQMSGKQNDQALREAAVELKKQRALESLKNPPTAPVATDNKTNEPSK